MASIKVQQGDAPASADSMRPVTFITSPKGLMEPRASAQVVPTLAELQSEVTFIDGLTGDGKVAATSFGSWNRDNPASYAQSAVVAKWGSGTPGATGGTVYFTFAAASNWTEAEKGAFRAGFVLWSALANVSWVETGVPANASLTVNRGADGGAHEDDTDPRVAIGAATITSKGAASINIDTSVVGFGPIAVDFATYGGYPFSTVVHEQGHAMGLGHGGAYNGNVNSATQQFSQYDTRLYSTMSYINAEDQGAKYYAPGTFWGSGVVGSTTIYRAPATPMILDILAVQQMYGAPTSTPFDGGEVFGFNTNLTGGVKPFYDFTQNTSPIVTIWDKGRNNTLDLSGFSTGSIIDLNPGAFSSAGADPVTGAPLRQNIAIAYGTHIETAIGGSGADTFYGNADDDTLKGNGGSDIFHIQAGRAVVDGGSETDVLNVDWSTATGAVLLSEQHMAVTGDTTRSVDFLNVETLSIRSGAGADTITTFHTAGSGFASGADSVQAGGGGDTVTGGDGADRLFGEGGDDILFGDGSAKIGGFGSTSYVYFSGDDFLAGGDGNDVLYGGAGSDVLDGGVGDDVLWGDGEFANGSLHLSPGEQNAVDTLYGGAGDDAIHSLLGGDQIDGGAGTDTLFYDRSASSADISTDASNLSAGFTSSDGVRAINIEKLVLVGGSGRNSFTGGTGPDLLTGGSGADTLIGGDGDDTLVGLAGDDVLNGGAGIDTVVYDGYAGRFIDPNGGYASIGVVVDLRITTPQDGGSFGRDTLLGVENVFGTEIADTLTGIDGSTLDGRGGSDTLVSTGGTETLIGGPGRDTAYVTSGRNTIDLGFEDNGQTIRGYDTVSYENAAGPVHVDLHLRTPQSTGVSIDTIISASGLIGSAFDDYLVGNDHLAGVTHDTFDFIIGGAGNDTIDGGGGYSYIYGGTGDDLIYGDTNPGSVANPTGHYDWGSNLNGEQGNDVIYGVASVFNAVDGGQGDDRLYGGDWFDSLSGGPGVNLISGGAWIDSASYAWASSGVTVDLAITGAQGTGASFDTLARIEELTRSDFNDVLMGDDREFFDDERAYFSENNPLGVYAIRRGANALYGGGGDDVLMGRGGSNSLSGGNGNDTVSYVWSMSAVTVGLGLHYGGDVSYVMMQNTGVSRDFISADIENLTGSAYNDVLTGDAGANMLTGGLGMDMLSGGFGADVLYGNQDADVLYGNQENDVLYGGQGNDAAYGGQGNDVVYGNLGDDALYGNLGDDVLFGGGGINRLDGGDGADTASYADALAGVSVSLALAGAAQAATSTDLAAEDGTYIGAEPMAAQPTGVSSDTLISIENLMGSPFADVLTGDPNANILSGGFGGDTLNGGYGADVLYGNQDDDMLYGNRDNDTLYGGLGNDALYGGQGDDALFGNLGDDVLFGNLGIDTFVFDRSFGHDRLADFGLGGFEKIRFLPGSFADYAALQSQMSQVGSDVLVVLDGANDILIVNTTTSGLTADHFIFG